MGIGGRPGPMVRGPHIVQRPLSQEIRAENEHSRVLEDRMRRRERRQRQKENSCRERQPSPGTVTSTRTES